VYLEVAMRKRVLSEGVQAAVVCGQVWCKGVCVGPSNKPRGFVVGARQGVKSWCGGAVCGDHTGLASEYLW
jgi:hypothetical protein